MIFHHIGLFVGDLSNGLSSLKKIIPIKQISQIVIEDKLDVEIQFCKDSSGIVYELIAPKGLDSPVLNTLKTKKLQVRRKFFTVGKRLNHKGAHRFLESRLSPLKMFFPFCTFSLTVCKNVLHLPE